MKKQITINQRKLSNLKKKFESVSHNDDNYSIGGGLVGGMSRRNENAKYDNGKLTLDQASSVLAGAFGVDKSDVKAIIQSTYTLEWHHAGFLPKSYGGGMRRIYYVNSTQINELIENFETIFENHLKKIEEKENVKAAAVAAELSREEKFFKKMEGLKKYLKFEKVERSRAMPDFVEKKEMNGKYGWFAADYKYSLDVYYSGFNLSNLNFWKRILKEDFEMLTKNLSKFENSNYISKSAERRENRANAAAQVAADEAKKAEVAAVAAAKAKLFEDFKSIPEKKLGLKKNAATVAAFEREFCKNVRKKSRIILERLKKLRMERNTRIFIEQNREKLHCLTSNRAIHDFIFGKQFGFLNFNRIKKEAEKIGCDLLRAANRVNREAVRLITARHFFKDEERLIRTICQTK